MHKKLTPAFAAFLLASTLFVAAPQISLGQSAPSVSMVTLQTMPGQNGQQMVVTPRGKVVPLPGAGVNSNVVQVYLGSQGGYWYVDKYGQQVDLTSAVQYMQQASQAGQVPQYAPQPVTVNNYEQPSSSNSGSSGGGSGAGTALAAGLGAATGAALTNAFMPNNGYYGGVPYGTPMYYGANHNPYYVDRGGNNVYVNNQNAYNRNTNVNASQVNTNAAEVNANQYHANNLQQQQDWYNKQASGKSQQYQNWQKSGNENPFVHQDAQNSWRQNGQGGQAQAQGQDGQGGGRRGRRNQEANGDGGGGGRFGRRNQDGGGANGAGGGFANREAQGGGAGGGFGNREAQGGGAGGGFGNRENREAAGGFGGRRGGGGGFGGRRGR